MIAGWIGTDEWLLLINEWMAEWVGTDKWMTGLIDEWMDRHR